MTYLCRKVEKDTVQQLATALAVADGASEELLQRARTAADNAAAEVQAGESLQDIMSGKLDAPPSSAVDALTQAIQAADQFPNLEVCPFTSDQMQHQQVLAGSIVQKRAFLPKHNSMSFMQSLSACNAIYTATQACHVQLHNAVTACHGSLCISSAGPYVPTAVLVLPIVEAVIFLALCSSFIEDAEGLLTLVLLLFG